MNTTKDNFYRNPSKNTLLLFTFLWLLGNALLLLSITNLFTESFFHYANVMIYVLMVGSTITIIKLYTNYRKNKTR